MESGAITECLEPSLIDPGASLVGSAVIIHRLRYGRWWGRGQTLSAISDDSVRNSHVCAGAAPPCPVSPPLLPPPRPLRLPCRPRAWRPPAAAASPPPVVARAREECGLPTRPRFPDTVVIQVPRQLPSSPSLPVGQISYRLTIL
jgi:hypothetical protein